MFSGQLLNKRESTTILSFCVFFHFTFIFLLSSYEMNPKRVERTREGGREERGSEGEGEITKVRQYWYIVSCCQNEVPIWRESAVSHFLLCGIWFLDLYKDRLLNMWGEEERVRESRGEGKHKRRVREEEEGERKREGNWRREGNKTRVYNTRSNLFFEKWEPRFPLWLIVLFTV